MWCALNAFVAAQRNHLQCRLRNGTIVCLRTAGFAMFVRSGFAFVAVVASWMVAMNFDDVFKFVIASAKGRPTHLAARGMPEPVAGFLMDNLVLVVVLCSYSIFVLV